VRAQLEAEGIIRDVGSVETAPRDSWWSGFAQFFRPRVLATVAATALVVAGGIYFTKRVPKPSNEPVATAETSKTSGQPARNVEAAETKTASAISPKHGGSAAGPSRVALPPLPRPSTTELAPSPTETAYLGDSAAVLADTESNLPKRRLGGNAMVDASLRQNLRTLNEFISECEARLKQNPQDQLTREYLNMAYQQKAELLTAMMDSGRSEH
jgi:hypothetical protein